MSPTKDHSYVQTVNALNAKLQKPWQDVGMYFADDVILGEEDHHSDTEPVFPEEDDSSQRQDSESDDRLAEPEVR